MHLNADSGQSIPSPSLSTASRPCYGRALLEGSPAAIGFGIAILLTIFWFFWDFIDNQLGFGPGLLPFLDVQTPGISWNEPEDWGHSYLVPLLSAYVCWQRRDKLLGVPVQTFWPGLMMVLLGIACYTFFTLRYPNHMFQGASLVLVLAGASCTLLGPRILWHLAFPIGFLLLGVTISEMVMNKITYQLQDMAAVGSAVLMNALTIETELRGNVLHPVNPFTGEEMGPLNVAEACSGMRMVIAFIALSFAVAYFSTREWWQRIAVVLLAVPIALLMNVVRVTLLGVLSIFNPALAAGDAHTFIGMILLFPSFMLFMGCVWAIKRIFVEQSAAPATSVSKPATGGGS